MKKLFLAIIAIIIIFSSCSSINKLAMNKVADMLSETGSSTVFTGDPDPKLVGDALPFAIKIFESLLDSNPNHPGLALTTGSLFVMYANAFVQGPAEMLPNSEWKARQDGLNRAKQMYLRGVKILYNGMENKYKGFIQAASDPKALETYLNKFKKEDVPFLYWAAAGGLSAYSIDLLDFELSDKMPEWSAMIHRAYELDPDFNNTAIDEFFIIFYSAVPEMMGGDTEKAKFYYQRALEKSGGKSVSAYVSYAQSICIPERDYDTFKECLDKALAVNPDDDESTRLVNIITQQKAQWLLDNAWIYFSFLPIPDDY